MANHPTTLAGWYRRTDGTRGYWNGTHWLDAAGTSHPAPPPAARIIDRAPSRGAQLGSAAGRPTGYTLMGSSNPMGPRASTAAILWVVVGVVGAIIFLIALAAGG